MHKAALLSVALTGISVLLCFRYHECVSRIDLEEGEKNNSKDLNWGPASCNNKIVHQFCQLVTASTDLAIGWLLMRFCSDRTTGSKALGKYKLLCYDMTVAMSVPLIASDCS